VTEHAGALRIEGLSFRYPGSDRPVLSDLSLQLAPGERVAVLGPNGSGKTTLALHLNGLLELQSGRIEVGGLPVAPEHLGEIRRRVGLVFQDPDDQLFLQTVRDDVAFGPTNLGVRGDERDRRVDAALAAVGATGLADRNPYQLSGGEQRRAALATVLSMAPDVLVLDEPTSGLDPVGRRELAELLVGLGPTQLVVTHDLPFALATCPRSVILDGGTVVADGPTRQLLADAELLARHRLELPFGYRLA
jgi:energy-coupling factor transporter ATP-binding protein EcfA2